MIVVRLFLTMPQICLQSVTVVFPDHTHLLFLFVDLVYKLARIFGFYNFSAQFIKIISHFKKIGYNNNVLQQTTCFVVNPITVGNCAFLFNCMPVGQTSDSRTVLT